MLMQKVRREVVVLMLSLSLQLLATGPIEAQGKVAAPKLRPEQRKAIEQVLSLADTFDAQYQRRDLHGADRTIRAMAKGYLGAREKLPKQDTRLLLCNMMDGYTQLGLGLWSIPKAVSEEELAARFLKVSLQKFLLRNHLQGKAPEGQSCMLESLRKQGQEGC